MATIHLPPDFRDFFRLLGVHAVDYLLVGGYAVAYHGFPRATMDVDVWVAIDPGNARRIVAALEEFGFAGEKLSADLFLEPNQVIRMGLPPMRIEILTSISGVDYADASAHRVETTLDGVELRVIGLHHLKANKLAAGRAKDLADLEELP